MPGHNKLANALRAVAGITPSEDRFNSAIILAAGIGSRMGDTPCTKQLIALDGTPVIVHTLLAFQRCSYVKEIIVVAREKELSLYDGFAAEYGITKLAAVVCGGKTRQESVMCGTKAISDRSEYLAIHDGARCLVTPEIIAKTFEAAVRFGAAVAAESMTDTVKRCDGNMLVTETLDRSVLWRAQTPQTFKTSLYLASAYTAFENGIEATDDSALAESIGFRVKLVDCGRENLKITTRDDLIIAEAILTARKIHAANM